MWKAKLWPFHQPTIIPIVMKPSIWQFAFGIVPQILPAWSTTEPGKQVEALHRRNVFSAGGNYVFNATQNGTILINQQYFEQLTPAGGVKHPYPLIFIHGGGISGTVSLGKPLVYQATKHIMVSNGSTKTTVTLDGQPSFSIRAI